MKILIVGGTPSHRGGVEQFCDRAENALIDAGRHQIRRIQSNTAYFRAKSLNGVWQCVRQLFENRNGQWDCLWLQYVNLPDLVLLLICRFLQYTVLVTPHLGSNWASQSNSFLRGLGLKLLGTASGIALISVTQAEELVLPRAVPQFHIKTFLPQHFPSKTAPSRKRAENLKLIHAGRLSDGKGSFLFLEVCSILKQRGCSFYAQLIGSCDDITKQRIDDFIRQADLAGCVDYVKPLPEVQLLTALSQADVLVHLSQIDSFPLIVLEAIGCGVFPVCKNLAGARFMTQTYCGHLVEGSSMVNEVADFLLSTPAPELRAVAARASERLVADYDWGSCVTALEGAVKGVARL